MQQTHFAGGKNFMLRLVQEVPRGALIFGTAGLVPYIATSITTVYLARQAFLADRGLRMCHLLLLLSSLFHHEMFSLSHKVFLNLWVVSMPVVFQRPSSTSIAL
jgi:hypothetical protein